ncbi:hypothetical protein MGG_08821 [Pyricularia oryzae 70-15]|uniref:Pre-rRNA-processing protein RIX1 n=1 Tax=Pyricularia oryzae (strain 70-15 / ATCC MYA-4617 / FGSC 8958) TaxID=242507 RepID=G4MUQ7_PYRO7|nr:uncharacterized protein MGG_08821 [Pyricularia oryzae 70-15]EHA54030.1 hypothetical protein MGG_08821 [Pyricularia oryzae 70-15]
MAANSDLRVVCRKLKSTPADDLLNVCPSLVQHVIHSGRALTAPVEQKPKDGGSETAMLVHKLKTHITTLLNGKTPASRFAGMALVKSVVDAGGWECLRAAEPWVRGLLSMLQKPDPVSAKELCVVTLVRIYTLLHEYPTLVREIATPTIPNFANACLQILKSSASSKTPKAPLDFVETIISAFGALVPLYPTTLRPFNSQIKSVIRLYLAPTSSDPVVVPSSLQQASRRLAILLHNTAPKNTHPEEWANLLAAWIKDSHATADQVFRAVNESWEPSTGRASHSISTDGEPEGGGKLAEELPAWWGLSCGAQRLLGLFASVSEAIRTSTKSTVVLPIAALTDLTSRVLLVNAPTPGSHERDLGTQLNPGIGREERDELWSVLPLLHVAALQLQLLLVRRLGRGSIPLSSSILDQAVRAHALNPKLSATRQVTFTLIREILLICGPTLPKISVDTLGPVIQSCCHDLLAAAGFAPEQKSTGETRQSNGTKTGAGKGSVQANADLFLPNKDKDSTGTQQRKQSTTDEPLLSAARALLEAALSQLPQHHLKKADRALLDRTAILSGDKAAMLAGVLHPYIDRSGRLFANTYPFLARQHPHDAGVELLRSNLRTKPHHFGSVLAAGRELQGGGEESGEEDEDEAAPARASAVMAVHDEDDLAVQNQVQTEASAAQPVGFAQHLRSIEMEVDIPAVDEDKSNTAPFVPLVLKRKSVEVESETPAKRQDKGKGTEAVVPLQEAVKAPGGDASDSDDESVQLEMAFDEDDDEDE